MAAARGSKKETRITPPSLDPPELRQIIQEATRQVEDELAMEDRGWIGTTAYAIITEPNRTEYVKLSRLYFLKDPLAKQAIRLWVDYTFGPGMTWSCADERASAALSKYWDSRDNQPVLSAKGQRRTAMRLLVDGEVFFTMFLGPKGKATVRLLDALEITEIITNPDDRDDERYFKREWADAQGGFHTDYYCSHRNPKDQGCKDFSGTVRQATKRAKNVLVYHFAWDNQGNRGMPLLIPALDWIKQYRRFLASRVAIMLALARFAWRLKTKGGAAAVAAAKGKLDGEEIPAGSTSLENEGTRLDPIKTDSGARNAYNDGRMLKLQVCAAVGIPEQYFGDIESGNLATAKTVELPMMKMFQSFQAVFADAFRDMDEIILEHNNLKPDVHVDRDFPAIAPEDVFEAAKAIATIITAMPDFAEIPDVQQVALMSLGINNPAEVLDQLKKMPESMAQVKLTRALKEFKEALERS